MLSNAYALAQFYDRDAPAEMAKAGMEGFQEFMVKPDNQAQILERLEKVRAASTSDVKTAGRLPLEAASPPIRPAAAIAASGPACPPADRLNLHRPSPSRHPRPADDDDRHADGPRSAHARPAQPKWLAPPCSWLPASGCSCST